VKVSFILGWRLIVDFNEVIIIVIVNHSYAGNEFAKERIQGHLHYLSYLAINLNSSLAGHILCELHRKVKGLSFIVIKSMMLLFFFHRTTCARSMDVASAASEEAEDIFDAELFIDKRLTCVFDLICLHEFSVLLSAQ